MTDNAETTEDRLPAASTTDRRLWLEVAAVLGVTALPSTYAAVASLLAPADHGPSFTSWMVFLIVQATGWVLLALALVSASGLPAWSFGMGRIRWALDITVGVVLTVAYQLNIVLLYIANSRWRLPLTWYPPPEPARVVDWVLLPIAEIVNAAGEELVMRAYVITRLSALLRSKFRGALVSTLIFASYHVYQGSGGTLEAFLFGALMAGAFCVTGRVWPLVVAHFLSNMVSRLWWV